MPSSAGTIRSDGNAWSHSTARMSRGVSQRSRLVERDADALPEQPVDAVLEHPLGVVEELPALVGELVEAEAEAAVEVDVVGRRRARARRRGGSRPPRGGRGSGAPRRARSAPPRARCRLARSGSFAIAGRSIRYGIVCPSTVASSVASSSLARASCAFGQVAEVAAAGELPELLDAAVARPPLPARPIAASSVVRSVVALVDRLDVELVLVARRNGGSTPPASPPRTGRPARGTRSRSMVWTDGSATGLGYPRARDHPEDRAADPARRDHGRGASRRSAARTAPRRRSSTCRTRPQA